MVKTKLVDQLIQDGAAILSKLDASGFPVGSMFWVRLPDRDYWRLVIASPFVAQFGGLAGYRRLIELLQGVELAGVTAEDISLLEPESPDFQSFYSLACRSSRLAAGPAWFELEEAVVYRWTGASVSAELGCEVSADELQAFWDAERARLSASLPALLFAKQDQRVTLRLHPRNGPDERIEGIKPAFVQALHRPSARPGCQVTWLN